MKRYARLVACLLIAIVTSATALVAQGQDVLRQFIERGNALVREGQYAQARGEYQKALLRLPAEAQGPILQTVARCHYLEGNTDAAVTSLRLAVLVDPDDETGRQLLKTILGDVGREDEAVAFLERVDREGAKALLRELPPQQRPGFLRTVRLEDDIEAFPVEAGRKGRYRVFLTERSPLGTLGEYFERHRLGPREKAEVEELAEPYEIREESFEVYVPETYGEDEGEESYGLFVWISPIPMGAPRPDHLPVLDARKMIWVGANSSGNARRTWDRKSLALDAVQAMRQLYKIDDERVYVGGYSGGGRVASHLSVLYPDVFQGGFLFMGCDYYRDVPFPDDPLPENGGRIWPASFKVPKRDVLKLAKSRNRYAFVTGEQDFNRAQTLAYYRRYKADGFRHVDYLEIPGANHYYGVRGEWLEKGLAVLDGK